MSEDSSFLRERVRELERKNEDLLRDNGKQRDELRDLKAELSTAQGKVSELEKQVPAEGALVLPATQREVYEGYKALGKLDELKAQLEAKSSAEQRLSAMERREVIRSAGYEPKALERLIGDAGLKVAGEGEERRILLLQGEEESDLIAWAENEGILTLLNAARLETEVKPSGVPAAGQAGRREAGRLKTVEERIAEKRADSLYSI
jgi:predicted nuclease with TOPRIM domain